MVNNRGPSKGCQRCKKLKIKCSQDQPSCRRCENTGHSCVYPSPFDRLHRDQNTAGKLLATKKWRQRAYPKPEENLPLGLDETLWERAYRRFCFDFVTPPPGTLSNIPDLMTRADPESCVASAVAAVSYANYSSRYRSYEAGEVSSVCYGRTLQRLATLMTNPVEMRREGVPLVIFLLCIYETMTSSVRDGSWITHMQGTQSILACRDSINHNDNDQYLYVLCKHLIVYYFQEDKTPPLHLDDWIHKIAFRFDHERQLAALMLRTLSIITRLRENTSVNRRVAPELLQSALNLDLDLETWAMELPPTWSSTTQHPLRHENRPQWSRNILEGAGGPRYMICYARPLAAADSNTYRATRIRLHLAIIDFLSILPAPPLECQILKAHVTELLSSLVGEIACVFPYALSLSADGTTDPPSAADIPGMRAYLQLWPIVTAYVCCQLHLHKGDGWVDRAHWFRGVLGVFRDSMCLAKVQALLDEARV